VQEQAITVPAKVVLISPSITKEGPTKLTEKSMEQETKMSLTPAGKIQFCLPAWRKILGSGGGEGLPTRTGTNLKDRSLCPVINLKPLSY